MGTKAFSDLKVNFKDTAEFICEVSEDSVKGKWYKNGVAIDPEKDPRFKISEIGCKRKLVIENVCNDDQGEYSFEAEGHPACKLSAALEATGAMVSVEKKKEAPKILLDRSEDTSLTVKDGNNLRIEVNGLKENSTVKWVRGGKDDENAKIIEADGKRIWKTTSLDKGNSILSLTNAGYDDIDHYTCFTETLDEETNELHKKVYEFLVMVIDVPAPPENVVIGEITEDSCVIEWSPPADDGGCEFKGYTIERKKAKSNRWIRLNGALCTFHKFHAKRMVEGTVYQIRVIAVNEVGPSAPSESSKEFMPIAPITGFKIGKCTDESIELKWFEPDEIGAGGLDGYVVEMMKWPSETEKWGEAPCGLVDPKSTRIDITKLETGKSYKFRVCTTNSAGRSKWEYLGPIICAEAVEDAKITIPRNYNKKIKILVGQPLKLIIPYQGKPKPVITWTKDEKPIDTERFHIRNVADSTTIFCRSSDRWDGGIYELEIVVGDQKVSAKFDVAIIDIPSKPIKVTISEVISTSVALKWGPPKDCGDCELIGYQVEKRDARSPSDEWYVCVDKVRHNHVQSDNVKQLNQGVQINDLVLGNSYFFRVRAINEVGLGDDACSKESAHIPKEVSVYKKPELPPLDFRTKPEFTLGLADRRVTQGYNGLLSCALKGYPKPKLRWWKGKIEINDNPKFKTTFSEGIVQLEIRRAQLGEAGVYKLVASNEMGEATTECQVTIREVS